MKLKKLINYYIFNFTYLYIKMYIKHYYLSNIQFYNIIFFKNFYNFLKLFFKKDSLYPLYNYTIGLEYKLLTLINFFFLKKNNSTYLQKLIINKFLINYFNSIKISILPFFKKNFNFIVFFYLNFLSFFYLNYKTNLNIFYNFFFIKNNYLFFPFINTFLFKIKNF